MKAWKHRLRQGLVLVLAAAMITGCLSGAALPVLAEENVVTTSSLASETTEPESTTVSETEEEQTTDSSKETPKNQEAVLTAQAAKAKAAVPADITPPEGQTQSEGTTAATKAPESDGTSTATKASDSDGTSTATTAPESDGTTTVTKAAESDGTSTATKASETSEAKASTEGKPESEASGTKVTVDETTKPKEPEEQAQTTEAKEPEGQAQTTEAKEPEGQAQTTEAKEPEEQAQTSETAKTGKQKVKAPAASTESTEKTSTEPVDPTTGTEESEETTPAIVEGPIEETVFFPETELPDNDELFAAYVEQLLYQDMNAGIELFGNFGETKLTGKDQDLYDFLKAQLHEIADGRVPSTQLDLSGRTWTFDELGLAPNTTEIDTAAGQAMVNKVKSVLSYVFVDCPYDLYWYDKTNTGGMSISYSVAVDQTQKTVTARVLELKFAVAKDYRLESSVSEGISYTVDTAKISVVKTAVTNANNIVTKYKDKSDYEKLTAYKNEICNLVSYNNSAADDSTNTPYGNPWQLIWVFDGNSSTNVVCEGYSKAFQYLCDLSTFQNAVCYTVTGTMGGGTGAGRHMWNIVTLDGKNYLADVTNSDTGTAGANGGLFLAGTNTGSAESGYTIINIRYQYDSDQLNLFGTGILTLASENYSPKPAVTITVPTNVTVTYGNDVSAMNWTGFSAKGKNDVSVQGTFSWAADVKSYGDAGEKTLKVVFTPESTSAYRTTETEVTVTVQPKSITVSATATGKTYGEKDPELTYTSTGLVEGDKLSGTLSREPGEDATTYTIQQGGVTSENNPNYTITFQPADFTIRPADYTVNAKLSQNILAGVGAFVEPTFTGVKDESVAGTLTYTYDNTTGPFDTIKTKLATLRAGTTANVAYTFTATDTNYQNTPKTGTLTLTVKEIIFLSGEDEATSANAVTIKENPVYGDTWADIVQMKNLKATAGEATDDNAAHFTVKETVRPAVGKQTYTIVYNGTINNKTYKDAEVCSGTVTIGQKPITVTAGTYQVSKTYDGTTAAGTATGSLRIDGILDDEKDDVMVTTMPVDYTSANVGGQSSMELTLSLVGAKAGNYKLAQTEVKVPCGITAKSITPEISMTDTYTYTGSEIVPTDIAVKDGEELLAADQYTVACRNNINAGTAEVTISPKSGANYTWTPVRRNFTILKADHADESVNGDTRYGGTRKYDLAELLPTGYKLGTIKFTDADGIFSADPILDGTTLSWSLNRQTEKTGKTARITVPVTVTANYNAYNVVVTITMLDKLPQQNFRFASSSVSKTYGDAAFSMPASGAAAGSEVTYASSDPAVAAIDENGMVRVLACGTATITAYASETDDYAPASVECALTVAPKLLSWDVSELYAVDREGSIVEKAASLYGELHITGMLEDDVQDVTFTCPAEKLAGLYEAVTPGRQNVTLSWTDAEHPAELTGKKSGQYRLPDTLPAIEGTINAVTSSANLPESTESIQLKVEMEDGISTVPDAFVNQEHLNTPAKILKQMYLNIQKQSKDIPESRIQILDVVLMVRETGKEWRQATKENFPSAGITLVLPYPKGTGQNTHDFVVSHMFTTDMNGFRAGAVEYPEVTKTEEGIRFKVRGLSPIAIGWTEIADAQTPAQPTQPAQKPDEKPADNGGNKGGSGGSENKSGGTAATAAAAPQPTTTAAANATPLQAVRSANTGDRTSVAGLAVLMLISAAGLAGLYIKDLRKKKH